MPANEEIHPTRIRFLRLVHAAKRGLWDEVEKELKTVTDEEIDLAQAATLLQIGATKECVLDFLVAKFKELFGRDEIDGSENESIEALAEASSRLLSETGINPDWIKAIERILNKREPMTVAAMLKYEPERIMKIRCIGKKGWLEIRSILRDAGLGY